MQRCKRQTWIHHPKYSKSFPCHLERRRHSTRLEQRPHCEIIPKKGNLCNCDNWRGIITLLSVPSEVFFKFLLKRIDKIVDEKLREEQAGFRRGRGCIDKMFTLRNIIEQCIEWNTPLFINFIDFKRAFESTGVHRETLWKMVKSYRIPPKILMLIKAFYNRFECSVILDSSISLIWS